MKSNKRVFVMTPASLKDEFFSEMKKCGDELYKKNQYWEFISIEGNPEYVKVLSRALNLSPGFYRKKKGAWLVNINKESNFTDLNTTDQLAIDTQLNEMIITRNPFGFIVSIKKRGALKGQTKKKGGKKKRKTEKKYPIAEQILYQKENLEDMFDDVEERDLQPYTGGSGEIMERYNGVKLDEAGNITNQEFIDNVVKILKKDKLDIDEKNIIENKYQCLPDKTDDFINEFVSCRDSAN